MTARSRSRSAGLSRGSAPDLRRVLDVHRHSAITLTSAQHHTSLDVEHSAAAATGTDNDTTGIARLPTEAEADSHQASHRRDEASHNGVVTNHHHPHHHHQQQQQQQMTTAATTTVKLDDVFKITEHVPVRD